MSKAGSEMERITCLKGRTGTTPAPRSLQEGVCVHVTFCRVHAEGVDASNFVLGVEMPASQGCGCISEWQTQETVLSHDFFLSLWVPYPSLPHVFCYPSRSTPSSSSSLSVPSSSLGVYTAWLVLLFQAHRLRL